MYEMSKTSKAITHASTGFPTVDRLLHRANLIIGDVVHPFLMQVVKDAWHGETTEKDLDDVIRIIESYIFRRLICQVDRKSTRLNSSHVAISYAVFCLKKKKKQTTNITNREIQQSKQDQKSR